MSNGYRSTGIFLASSEGAGFDASWNPYPTGGHFAGWNPNPTGGHFAGWNPDPVRGQHLNPNPTGGHYAAWNPDPVRGNPLNPNPTGGHGQPTQRSELSYDAATASPWPWRRFDADWTYTSGSPALMAQALRKVRTRLIGEGDVRRNKARMGQVRVPAPMATALWRWGSEFRQQAVVAELLSHVAVQGARIYCTALDFGAPAPTAILHPLFDLQPPAASFEYSQQIDKVLRAAVEREERLPEILTQAVDFRAFFNSLCGLDRAPTPHVDELVLVAWAWASHVVMVLKNNVAEYRPVQRSSLVMPIIATPHHGSLPSGHATIAVLTAHLLAALLYSAKDSRAVILHRLASRIAFNRVVAGVHFPMDSAVGCALGAQLAALFLAQTEAGGKLPVACTLAVREESEWDEGDTAAAALPAGSGIDAPAISTLHLMWRAAKQELRELNYF